MRTEKEIDKLANATCTYTTGKQQYLDGFAEGYTEGREESRKYRSSRHKEKIWDWFKGLVKDLRKYNSQLIREQGGSNNIMISVSMMDLNREDWIKFNPHSISIKDGKCKCFVDGTYQEIDVKYLLYNMRLKELEKDE